jgi:hypothetical protein
VNKILVYSCITGQYDSFQCIIKFPALANADHILFVDSLPSSLIRRQLADAGWIIKSISDLQTYSNLRDQAELNRYAKLCVHELVPGYEYLFYFDGNVLFSPSAPFFLMAKLIEANACLLSFKHPRRFRVNLIEAFDCVLHQKISFKEYARWLSRAPFGVLLKPVTANRVFIRCSNEVLDHTFSCIYQDYLKGPRRDQLHSWRFLDKHILLRLLSASEAASLFKVLPHEKLHPSVSIFEKLYLMFAALSLTLSTILSRTLLRS